jgi:Tfp pilus assembly protein PilO
VTFGTAAKASGLSLLSARPNLNALAGDAQFLPVEAVLRGDFLRFRNFLIHIGSLPYVHHIEEITIQSKAEATEFQVKIWVAVG